MIKADLNWLSQILGVTATHLDDGGLSQAFTTVNTDSRVIESGQVFLALKGPNFDGHKFVEQVQQKGAVAAIVSDLQDIDFPQFVVPDTLKALGQLGAAVKQQVNPKTIAITGSVGKTSVKEMCAAILQQKGEVLATAGNFNNEIGVPLTLLRLEPKHQYAVVELGANHQGEIAYTTSLTKPDVAILNNVAEAHLEGFGSLLGVANAKGEIFQGIPVDGTGIYHGDSEFKAIWQEYLTDKFSNHSGTQIEFSLTQEAKDNNVTASDIILNENGCASFNLHLASKVQRVDLSVPGKHNVANALAAAAACYALGATLEEVASGLATMGSVQGRVNLHTVSSQLLVIDDSYNANVRSVNAAIDLLTAYQGHKVLVLGDMAELGEEAQRLHREVGEYAQTQGIDTLMSFGVLSQFASQQFEPDGRHFNAKEQLGQELQTLIDGATQRVVVLVKGSRSAKMELVVQELIENNQ